MERFLIFFCNFACLLAKFSLNSRKCGGWVSPLGYLRPVVGVHRKDALSPLVLLSLQRDAEVVVEIFFHIFFGFQIIFFIFAKEFSNSFCNSVAKVQKQIENQLFCGCFQGVLAAI